jgi:hypothetical protein
MKRLNAAWLLPLFILLRAGHVFADSETRPATPAEKQFYTRVMSTCAKALPPGPEGWTEHHTSSLTAPDKIRVGSEKGPLYLSFFNNWKNTKKIEGHDAKFNQALLQQSYQKPDPKVQTGLVDEYNKLSRELETAFKKGDRAEIQRLQKEMSVVAEKMKNLSSPAIQAVQNAIPKMPLDVEINIRVTANDFSQSLRSGTTAEAPIAGVLIYRDNALRSGAAGEKDGETYAFVGNWKNVSRSGRVEMASTPNPKLPYTAVQTILVVVGADKNRARAILEKINWAALQDLIRSSSLAAAVGGALAGRPRQASTFRIASGGLWAVCGKIEK